MNTPDPAQQPRRSPAPTARDAALHLLAGLRLAGPTARESLDALLDRQDILPRERGLAHELVLGVLRHHLTLRHVVAVLSGRDWKNVNRRLQPVLLLGAYQLLYLDGIPPFAAVNEAVEQAKRAGGPSAGRFVNALLRRLERDIQHRRIAGEQSDPVRAIPVEPAHGGRASCTPPPAGETPAPHQTAAVCCQLRTPVLPDPGRQPIDHLALFTSHPIWLVSRWASALGLEQARQICRSGMSRPPMILRPNRLRTDLDKLAEALRADGIETLRDDDAGVLILPHAAHIARSAAFAAGLFQVQDRTAMGVVKAMNPAPGSTVIDLCAGPGTKTTQMAEIMNDNGTILAGDKDDDRLALVRENCGRLGVTCVRTVPPWDREAAFQALARIDWVLVDAPCSNTGVLARRPEARYRVDARSLASLAALQKQLLSDAAGFARPHTRLAYSTCSLEPEENEGLVAWFAQVHPAWHLLSTCRTFPTVGQDPTDWSDGGFWALWERT